MDAEAAASGGGPPAQLSAGSLAAVMVISSGRVDGRGCGCGGPWCWRCLGSVGAQIVLWRFVWWRHVFPRGGQVLEVPRCGMVERPWAKALCFGTSDDDVCGCRVPLEGVVEVPLAKPGLRMKTLDRSLGLDGGVTVCRLPLEGVFVELRFPLVHHAVIGGHFQILSWSSLGSCMGGFPPSYSFTRVLVGSTRGPSFSHAGSGSTIRSGGSSPAGTSSDWRNEVRRFTLVGVFPSMLVV